ncbi:conserved hypothetical protein [Ricinus communis]|uniref:Structural constituent of cell wall n=1 Tax=Ricinus communis TaxID=3988 RepID=B9T646_RICCO|nr:conserved hypothetical protein [Ricinus communis]
MVGFNSKMFLIILLVFVYSAAEIFAATVTCRKGPCFLKKISCPAECPQTTSYEPKAKVCYLNCNSPVCKPECRQVQFKFYGLSPKVEGVLGRTYQPDFENPAKPGVAMPVVGGEDKYRTSSLLSADCGSCMFSSAGSLDQEDPLVMDFSMLDCAGGYSSGHGIVCKK